MSEQDSVMDELMKKNLLLIEAEKRRDWYREKYTSVLDQRNELLDALRLAVRYLEHPDVQSIPFALPASAPLERARAAIEKAVA